MAGHAGGLSTEMLFSYEVFEKANEISTQGFFRILYEDQKWNFGDIFDAFEANQNSLSSQLDFYAMSAWAAVLPGWN